MSLSCHISCFPLDCIKENTQQLALGELLVQKKLRPRTSISLIFCIVPSNGTRHLSTSHLRWLFYIFFPLSNWHYTYCFFSFSPQPLETPEAPLADWAFYHSSSFSQVPLPAAPKSKGCANPRAVCSGCPATPLLLLNPLKKCIAEIICLTIATLAGRGALLC